MIKASQTPGARSALVRTRKDLHPYQHKAIRFLRDRKFAALWLDMGLGKTIATLTAAVDALLLGDIDIIFLFAPIRVIQTVWRQEAKRWAHTRHLRFSLVHGNEGQRCDALRKKADIYLINYENIVWLRTMSLTMPGFPKGRRGMVLDEASKMKAPKTKRFKTMKKMRSMFDLVWELTGTPAPNSYMDIWAQVFLMDNGRRFGDSYELFRQEFFYRPNEYEEYTYRLRRGSQTRIERALAPLVLRLDSRDYKQMPPVVENNILIDLPHQIQAQYEALEKEFFLQLEEQHSIEAFNAAALSAKLWQFANGAVLDTDKVWHAVHDEKLHALEDVLEEACGTPVLIAYWFRSDLARLKVFFKQKYRIDVKVFSESKNPDALISQWADGAVPYMLIHPASGGHGIDRLQHGGHILTMYSQTWSLEMHDQLVARLNRQGQKLPVIVHYLLANNTVDLAIREAIATKSRTQAQLLNALRRYNRREMFGDLLS